jgi:hypothetical protein
MKFIKTETTQSEDVKTTLKKENKKKETFDITQIWHCLNCSEEWKIDIINNIWRKTELID